ncbi:hypothetical protein GGQ74_003090 [Desulfobaculum xiamenense]|uniref:DUF3124 domain-containing protein n=1 Tax=Desulfobaculum xiamenense TaxID=995050 RepID=A0A846QMM6_9BACT|nr:DUF3124 domain-containing protein [Desulfobaculum xiamenense]NJB69388.1 hypothetical protein [Desulfobaculum xiamenense]
MLHVFRSVLALLILAAFLTASPAMAEDFLGKSRGQTIYVPSYSHIYHGMKNRSVQLTTMLSVRNTNPRETITLTAVKYYDTDGNLVRNYLPEPVSVGSMATREFIVALKDTQGGSGANFIVEWTSDKQVTNPIVETLMISTESSLGISFLCEGRVIAERDGTKR